MTVTPSSPVVGIFKDRSMAEQAIDALYNAGFTSEQIRYSVPGTSGSILADLKSLFTGQNASGGNIANDLTDMGLSDEEAQYYSNEYKNGNTVLAVSASTREQEALTILHQYGVYNARTSDASPESTYSQQPSDAYQQTTYTPDTNQQAVYTPDAHQQATYTPDETQHAAYTPDETSSQQDSASTRTTQEQPSDVEDHPFQNAQQNVVIPASDTEAQDYQLDEEPAAQNTERQPTEPLAPGYHSMPQDTLSDDAGTLEATPDSQVTPSDAVISDYTPDAQTSASELTDTDATPEYQATPSDAMVTDSTAEPQSNQADVAPSDQMVTDSTAEPQATQTDVAPSDQVVTDSTSMSQNASLATNTPYEYESEFQQLQARLQAAQQQLQDARAQLQAAKERESQIQDARQQLKDVQEQLQTTLAELHETHQRISQYQ